MIEARYLDVGGALGFVEIVPPDAHPAPDTLPTVLCIHTAGQSGGCSTGTSPVTSPPAATVSSFPIFPATDVPNPPPRTGRSRR